LLDVVVGVEILDGNRVGCDNDGEDGKIGKIMKARGVVFVNIIVHRWQCKGEPSIMPVVGWQFEFEWVQVRLKSPPYLPRRRLDFEKRK
jgi:hypothetical protein